MAHSVTRPGFACTPLCGGSQLAVDASATAPLVDAPTLAAWMRIETDELMDLVDCGRVPCRVGAKGPRFDVDSVQSSVSLHREAPAYEISGRELKQIVLSLNSASDAMDAWQKGTAHVMRICSARSAAAFATDPEAWLRPIALVGADLGDRRSALESLAVWVAICERGATISVPVEPGQPAEPVSAQLAALPVQLDGRTWGVIVLDGDESSSPVGLDRLAAAESVAANLALVLQRLESRAALADHHAHDELNQRQMEAFARDVRSTFTAEKERAEQLAQALDELEKTYLATVKGLAVAVEAKDEYTAGHLQRVTRYGMTMMRVLAPHEASDPQYEYGFLLHDVGKIAIPDAVLKKEGPLDEEEWEIMRSHAEMGRRILQDIPFLAGAREIVYAHHERWDGRGYPRGLAGEDIPLGARIFSIADSFDAMRSDRPYRKALPIEVARSEIRNGSGTQFWPPAVEAFLKIPVEDLEAVATQHFPHLGTFG